jgi:uncharacterized membrane protein
MKLPFFAFFCAALFCCCESTPTPIKTTPTPATPVLTYTGMYMEGTNGRTFLDCTSNNIYAIKDETHSLDTLYSNQFQLRKPYDNEPTFAILKGEINEVPASSGTVATTKGILLVKKVDSLSLINPRDCCLPFEYMAHGNEPFWSLEVYPEGKNIVFFVLGDTVATMATTPIAQTLGDVKTYTTQTIDGKPIKVTFKKGESNDGMSDFIYPYSVDVSLGKEKFSGVALRKGDVIKGME